MCIGFLCNRIIKARVEMFPLSLYTFRADGMIYLGMHKGHEQRTFFKTIFQRSGQRSNHQNNKVKLKFYFSLASIFSQKNLN